VGEEAMSAPNEAVRAQLKRVLGSRQFQLSELQQQFLSFVVERTLDGAGDEIKEYVIGAEAFGRGPDFDPRLDSVVRVVARRVRDRLAEYYQGDGRNDPVLILIEKGGYVPSFEIRQEEDAAEAPSAEAVAPSSVSEGASPDAAREDVSATAPMSPLAAGRARAGKWAGLGLIAAILLALVIYLLARPVPPPRISNYRQLTDDGQGKLNAVALSTPAPLVTDGSRIYFNEVSQSQVVISEVSASGGEPVQLRSDLKAPQVVMDISPDRSELLVADFFRASPEVQLRILPLLGGEPRPVGSLVGHDGAWSRDGAHICYANGNRLYLARSDGSDWKILTSLAGLPSWPRWSPDGKTLRFTVQDVNGSTSLWEVSTDGSGLKPLLPGWNDDHPSECCGNWSPDGKYFVFQSTRQGSTGLWAIRAGRWPFGGSRVVPARLTEGAGECMGSAVQPRGATDFRGGAAAEGRTGPLRCEPGELQPISCGHFCRSRGVLARSRMDCLFRVSRTDNLEKPGRWQRAPATQRGADGRDFSALVAGRQPHRVHGNVAGKAGEGLRCVRGRRFSGVAVAGRRSSDRSQLVAGWQFAYVLDAAGGGQYEHGTAGDPDF